MSLGIQCDDVAEVLLADGWYKVLFESFSIDAYEYLWGELVVHGGGNGGVTSSGFHFCGHKKDEPKKRRAMYGPLTAILAVATEKSKKKKDKKEIGYD